MGLVPRGATAALLACLLLGACGDGASARPDRDGDVGGAALAPRSCGWVSKPVELVLPQSEVQGVLAGRSRNASTGCTRGKGAGGPEAIYLLRLAQRRLVELEVTSALDTVIAVRRACDDPLTELACNDDAGLAGSAPAPGPARPPGRQVDAGVDAAAAPPPSGSGRDARLRTTLEAGDYYVLVDEAEAHGVGGPFVLRVGSGPPPPQTSCASAPAIADGTTLAGEELDLSTENAPSCTGGSPRPAFYYQASVPSGQRLTVRARATGGDRAWQPVLQLHAACTGGLCLGSDHDMRDGWRQLRYVNNGPAAEPVLLSVAANTAVAGATFILQASIAEPVQNGTCASARPLSDGLMLPAQELPEGRSTGGPRCTPASDRSLFYSASLLERQTLKVTVQRRNATAGPSPLALTVWELGCADTTCRGGLDEQVAYVNPGPGPRTVVLEVTSRSTQAALFDLSASMPLPPAGLRVTAAPGLQTSEAGGQARFEVALTSPPAAAVIIPIASSDPAEGTPGTSQLRFEPTGWQTPQTVTVTGVNDDRSDGTRRYQVRVGPASSDDPRYAGQEGAPVELANRDDEPGFAIEGPRLLRTSESGARATFQVALTRAPAATVRLPLASSDPGEALVQPAELVFEPNGWDQPRMVTVTGVDDDEVDGNAAYRIVTGPASSADPLYAGLDPEDPEASNLDDDHQPVPAQPVSGNLDCPTHPLAFHGQSAGRRMAVDQAGVLYVVLACKLPALALASVYAGSGTPTASVFVAVSEDGGRSWRPPVDTGLFGNSARIVAAGAGQVVVAASGPSGLTVGRSQDFGATWAAARSFSPTDSQWHLGAAGSRVVMTGSLQQDVAFWISDDSGRTFERIRGLRFFPFDLGVDAGSGTIWAAGYRGGPLLVTTSVDRGATFEPAVELGPEPFESIVVGPKQVYASTSEQPRLLVVARDGSARAWVGGLLATVMNPRLLIGDARDNVTVVEGGFERTDIRRLVAGATTFSPPRSLQPFEWPPDGVALSDSAVAIGLYRENRVFVTVETWP
jgi:hypothetical protein